MGTHSDSHGDPRLFKRTFLWDWYNFMNRSWLENSFFVSPFLGKGQENQVSWCLRQTFSTEDAGRKGQGGVRDVLPEAQSFYADNCVAVLWCPTHQQWVKLICVSCFKDIELTTKKKKKNLWPSDDCSQDGKWSDRCGHWLLPASSSLLFLSYYSCL